MRLLFDQNLSPRLVDRLKDVFPQALHVSQVDLSRVPDEVLWDSAPMPSSFAPRMRTSWT